MGKTQGRSRDGAGINRPVDGVGGVVRHKMKSKGVAQEGVLDPSVGHRRAQLQQRRREVGHGGDTVKKENPGIAFTDIGKVLGDKWRNMTVDDKEPYEAKARADKQRYKDEIVGYKNPQQQGSGNDSDAD